MNRLKDFFNDPQEPESQDDFYEVEKRFRSFAVTRQTAAEIETPRGQQDRRPWEDDDC